MSVEHTRLAWSRPLIRFHWDYPFVKLLEFMRATKIEPYGHALVIGPFAFVVLWRNERGK